MPPPLPPYASCAVAVRAAARPRPTLATTAIVIAASAFVLYGAVRHVHDGWRVGAASLHPIYLMPLLVVTLAGMMAACAAVPVAAMDLFRSRRVALALAAMAANVAAVGLLWSLFERIAG